MGLLGLLGLHASSLRRANLLGGAADGTRQGALTSTFSQFTYRLPRVMRCTRLHLGFLQAKGVSGSQREEETSVKVSPKPTKCVHCSADVMSTPSGFPSGNTAACIRQGTCLPVWSSPRQDLAPGTRLAARRLWGGSNDKNVSPVEGARPSPKPTGEGGG